MNIVLVNMPWALLDVPSLAVGILRRSAENAFPDAEVTVVHGNLDYVDWLLERREFTLSQFNLLALDSYFSGLGDWVFSSALYPDDDPERRIKEMTEELPLSDSDRELSIELHRSAPEFVDELARRIIALEPDVVGFTSTFQQNTASLATARAVKLAAPQVRTVFGGANCDGPQGAALHRNFDFVDYVVRGEGEQVFPALLGELAKGTPAPEALADIPGLCLRDGGTVRVNSMSTKPMRPADIVSPDYDGYFERLEESRARDWVEPKLVVEGSRGCWWGEKHHCTFCGLNGSFMEFRSKTPDAFYDEVIRQVERHQVLDMYVVDNILDMKYLSTVLPRLHESDYDLRLQFEIKSNMRREQLETLYRAGLVNVQPGIESLSSRVLKLMDKGVTGCLNVRMLRDAETVGLSVSWNYLYGFPGERPEDYLPLVAQFPALHHLAPMEGVARIVTERFSPNFDRPEFGFQPLKPDAQYRRNYNLPESEMLDLGYLFTAPHRGIDETTSDVLKAAGERWQAEHVHSRLSGVDLDDRIVLVSRRKDFDWTTMTLQDPFEVAVFRLLDQPHSVPALLHKLGGEASSTKLEALLSDWSRLGLVFTDDEHWVHIVPTATNQELLRFERIFDTRRKGTTDDETEPEPSLAG
ncbi:RiPP maturation radical SAM C-methyltransferase [Streptomyces xylophagus]|uniref:RiPP maturation radical SAM C-methyltransferase n=1 Tax=Streptomyces xylophagus TaxID=285514 RepID=UPI0005B83666|nr:RiPP maturation radical SAM C-methyltransferase [Streptomyces xylophagus]